MLGGLYYGATSYAAALPTGQATVNVTRRAVGTTSTVTPVAGQEVTLP